MWYVLTAEGQDPENPPDKVVTLDIICPVGRCSSVGPCLMEVGLVKIVIRKEIILKYL